jgi:hypothetical protein
MPFDCTLRTRLMVAASSAASSPLSVASPASFRMADMRIMIDDDPMPRDSRDARHALIVAVVAIRQGLYYTSAFRAIAVCLIGWLVYVGLILMFAT